MESAPNEDLRNIRTSTFFGRTWGAAQHRSSTRDSHSAALGSILGILKSLLFDVPEVYHRCLLKESGEWLETVD